MLAGFGQRGLEFGRPFLRLLPRPRIDQVERVAVEHLARDVDGVERFACGVQPAELGQHAIIERLHAERHAIDAGGAITAKALRLDAGRIGFQGDLGIGRDAPLPGDGIEHAGNGRRLHQRRRAAAEENRRHGAAARAFGGLSDLGVKGAQKTLLVDRRRGGHGC